MACEQCEFCSPILVGTLPASDRRLIHRLAAARPHSAHFGDRVFAFRNIFRLFEREFGSEVIGIGMPRRIWF